MLHLNGNLMCAVDTETTGDRPGFHDLIQVCILPLGWDLKPIFKTKEGRSLTPFYCELKPRRLENYTNEPKLNVKREVLSKICLDGLDPDSAADLFMEWYEKLNLAVNKRISPLAQNWPFDREFLMDWMGRAQFGHIFDARYRDTMSAALFENDKADFRNLHYPYPKVNLAYLASQLKVEHQRAHDALQDCVVTAEVYRRMLSTSI